MNTANFLVCCFVPLGQQDLKALPQIIFALLFTTALLNV